VPALAITLAAACSSPSPDPAGAPAAAAARDPVAEGYSAYQAAMSGAGGDRWSVTVARVGASPWHGVEQLSRYLEFVKAADHRVEGGESGPLAFAPHALAGAISIADAGVVDSGPTDDAGGAEADASTLDAGAPDTDAGTAGDDGGAVSTDAGTVGPFPPGPPPPDPGYCVEMVGDTCVCFSNYPCARLPVDPDCDQRIQPYLSRLYDPNFDPYDYPDLRYCVFDIPSTFYPYELGPDDPWGTGSTNPFDSGGSGGLASPAAKASAAGKITSLGLYRVTVRIGAETRRHFALEIVRADGRVHVYDPVLAGADRFVAQVQAQAGRGINDCVGGQALDGKSNSQASAAAVGTTVSVQCGPCAWVEVKSVAPKNDCSDWYYYCRKTTERAWDRYKKDQLVMSELWDRARLIAKAKMTCGMLDMPATQPPAKRCGLVGITTMGTDSDRTESSYARHTEAEKKLEGGVSFIATSMSTIPGPPGDQSLQIKDGFQLPIGYAMRLVGGAQLWGKANLQKQDAVNTNTSVGYQNTNTTSGQLTQPIPIQFSNTNGWTANGSVNTNSTINWGRQVDIVAEKNFNEWAEIRCKLSDPTKEYAP